nr:hypothetical protein [Tanacetum cinerariifolium]
MTDSSMSSTSDNEDLGDIELLLKVDDYDQSLQAGSSRTRIPINHDSDLAKERLIADYFGANGDPPKYPDYYFRLMRPDATGQMSFSIIMKCTSVIRQLAYDTSPNALDEYLKIGEHTAGDSLDHFTKCVIELFMPEYLRNPDLNDTQKLYTAHNADHGFLRILGSIIVCTGNGLIIQKHGTGNLGERDVDLLSCPN